MIDYDDYSIKNDIEVDMNNPKCINCNNCCTSNILFTHNDISRIKKMLSSDTVLLNKIVDNIKAKLKLYDEEDTLNAFCIFTGTDKKCLIYNILPEICSRYHCNKSMNTLNEFDISKYKPLCSTFAIIQYIIIKSKRLDVSDIRLGFYLTDATIKYIGG